MALRDQPYIPLYVQDFLTDEKLRECAASSVGVYIYMMCLMHKSDEYGTILLQQKDKQNPSNILNFAVKLVKHLPFSESTISVALEELCENKVLTIDGDKILQKRMVVDNSLSEIRAEAGKRGGFATAKSTAKLSAKQVANTEYEYEDEIKDIIDYLNSKTGKNYRCNVNKTKTIIGARLKEKFSVADFRTVIDNKCADWLGNSDMEKYLRPDTLFGTKFEGYLNQKSVKQQSTVIETSKGVFKI